MAPRNLRRPGLGLGQVWFPLALVGLFLLGIPGAVLLALNLLGRQGDVNAWLESNFSLSYHLALPWWAGLLMLLIPVAVLLLYFLKLKRRPLAVPSTFLWRKSIEDLHVNTLFQWLRNNILLLLQLLTLLALIYAVMAFQVHGATTQGRHYILILDNSASMAATDVAPNRLDQAKQEALKTIDAHTDNDFGMVIVFNSSAEIRQSYTSDRDRLRQAVRDVEPTQRVTRLEEALSLAASLANPTRSTEDVAVRPANEEPGKERTYVTPEGIRTAVHLFSDGRFPDVPNFSQGNLDLHLHLIGQLGADKVNNLGIVNVSAVRDDRDPSKLQVLVSVRNYRNRPEKVPVRLEVLIDGRHTGVVLEKPAQPQGEEAKDPDAATVPARVTRTLPPEKGKTEPTTVDQPGEGFVAFELADVDDRANVVLQVTLVGVRDDLPVDDKAWLVVGVIRKARVAIVGPPNKILDAFFEHDATRKVAQVTYLTPEDLRSNEKYRTPARGGAFDLVIFDRCHPETENDLPLANTFFIDDVPPPWKKSQFAKIETPHVKGWLGRHPLLRYLTALYDIGIAEAFQFDLKDPRVPPRTPRLLETDKDVAVMFALSRQSFTDLVQTFPLVTEDGDWVTNWPLQPSFPLFMRNVLYVLGNVNDAAGEENVQPGQPKTIRPDVAVQRIRVVNPDGQTETLDRGTRADFSYGRTDTVGVYQATWEGGGRGFEVNLFDADESNLEPRPVEQIKIGSAAVAEGKIDGQPREIWKWVALAALLLLLLEWYVYNRRIFV